MPMKDADVEGVDPRRITPEGPSKLLGPARVDDPGTAAAAAAAAAAATEDESAIMCCDEKGKVGACTAVMGLFAAAAAAATA
jgi:hypothetical protein